MIKVECVSCKSPYDVDERRVPESGMKMRCPSCNTSFMVARDGTTSPALGVTSLGTGPVAPPPSAAMSKTLVGQRAPSPLPFAADDGAAPPPPAAPPPAARNFKGTMVGMQAGITPPVAAGAHSAHAQPSVTDLPAVKPPPKPAVPWGSLAPPAPDAKSTGPARPLPSPASLPKGAMGGGPIAPPPSAAGNPNAGAASAFGAAPAPAPAGIPKRTMIGAAITPPPDQDFTDLPALKTQDAGFVDLPAPKGGRGEIEMDRLTQESIEVDDLGVDLPARKLSPATAAAAAAKPDVDLPAPKRAGAAGGAAFGEIDLPAPKQIADLPTPKAGFADLPAPRGVADLPIARGMTDLPTPKAGGFGELDLPMPKPPPMADESSFGDIDLPDLPPLPNNPPRGGAGFGDIELPSPRAGADIIPPKAPTVQGGHHAVRHQHDESSFGDLNAADSLPPSLLGNDDEANFGDVNTGDDMPPMPIHMGGASGAVANSIPPALFGEEPAEEHEDLSDDAIGDHDLVDDESSEEDDFGELPEGGEEDEGGGGESEEDMEFGMSEGGSDVALPPEMLRRQRGEDPEADQAARSKRAVQLVAAVAIVLAVIGGVGGALGFTNYGYFGVYYLERFMHGNGDATFVHGAIDRAQRTAATDTFRDAHKSLTELGIARKTAGLNRELLTRSLLHESLFLVRFGSETNSSAHVAHILQRLQERHNAAPGIELALAADAARRQAWNEVDPLLAVARAQTPNDPYVDLVAGEVAIRQGKLAEADKAFGLALKHGGAARAQWGLARVAIAKNDDKSAQAAIEETLKLSPLHVEARIAQARVLWLQGKEESALTRLRQALGLEAVDDQFLWTSKPAQAQGYAMLGYVYEQRARWPLARKAYDDALSADPYLVEGLLGAGRVMLRQRLYSDALVRFDSALNVTQKSTNPVVLSGRKADIEARLGQGRAMIALVRANDAKGVLSVLMNENPNDAEIVLAAGQVEEALKNRELAESLFKKSIELAPTSFAGYLALSQFYFRQNQVDKASETLNEAATKVEENAEMRRMLGTSEMARNRLDSAVHEFKRAVELDPQDLDAKFGLAQALRKTGELDAARGLLDEIAARDPQFAQLTLERGQLFEAQNDYAKAVASYKQALEKEPTSMDLQLRLGAAQVEGNMLDDAEQTLQKVIHEIPNSAEAEYFIGRIAFARGRGPDALTHFDRALSLDGTQAVFHLYSARAALSMQNLGRTNEEINIALQRDPSLGDAYWVRGEVRLRTGQVKDALKDLQRALALKPNRFEVYAAMAECYDELRQREQSAQMWRIAVQKYPERGDWWYMLGRLYNDMGDRGSAQESLSKAKDIGDAQDPIPAWLPDVYRIMGEIARATNNKKAAIALYMRYLQIAPEGAMDKEEVRGILRNWEVELNDE